LNTSKSKLRSNGKCPLAGPQTSRCSVPSCARPITPPLLFCKACWFKLSRVARDYVNTARQLNKSGEMPDDELRACVARAADTLSASEAEGGAR